MNLSTRIEVINIKLSFHSIIPIILGVQACENWPGSWSPNPAVPVLQPWLW